MLLIGVLGLFLIVGGVANAIREHGNGRENHVTAYLALALFGLGMVIAPIFMKGKPAKAVAAEPAPISPASLGLAPFNTLAMGESRSYEMEFEKCLGFLAEAGGIFGRAPINIVETNIVRVVRLPASDGSILLTCSRPDRKLVVALSHSRCGAEVNC
jgi:hypothetical protein